MRLESTNRIRVTYIFTHHIRWVPFELTAMLINKDEFDIEYIILGESDPIIAFLEKHRIPVTVIPFLGYRHTAETVKAVYDHLMCSQPDIVQTHWFAGSLIGLQAAFYAHVPVRVFHREHPPLQYYNRHPASQHKLIWECSTHVIAVTPKSKAGMIEDGIPADKITVIPTGFDVKTFSEVNEEKLEFVKKKYLGTDRLRCKWPVIGVAARHVRWKGVQYIIKAFKQILDCHPNALLVLSGGHITRANLKQKLAAANHDDIVAHQYDDALAIFACTEEIPADSFIEIAFEEDLFSLCRLFDVFVHTPIDDIQETFGQVYVEAMLARIPSVVTRSGSALDHAVHRVNAWIVDYENSQQIAEGVLALLADAELRQEIVDQAYACAVERYAIEPLIRRLETFYNQCLNDDQRVDQPPMACP